MIRKACLRILLMSAALAVTASFAPRKCFSAERTTQEFNYAQALADQGFLDLAETVYRDAVAAYPDHENVEEAVLAIASLKAQTRRFNEALSEYQTFMQKYAYSKLKSDAEAGIAEIHLEQKDFDRARKEFKKILDESKDGASMAYVRAQYGYAWCLMEASQYQEAAQSFKEFALIWQGYDRAQEARLALGECYMKMKQYDKALEAYDKARTNASSEGRVMRAMIGMARAHQALKNYKQALLAFDGAIKQDPSSPFVAMAMADKAECLFESGDEEGAKKILEDIMEKYPRTPDYERACNRLAKLASGGYGALQSEAERFSLAEAEFSEGNYEAAISRYENLLSKFPEGKYAPRSQQGIARCYAKMKDMKKAGNAFMVVAEKYPNNPIAVESLREAVRCYTDTGDTSQKEAALKKLAEAYPEAGKADAIHFQAAVVAYDGGDYKRAAQTFLELLEKYPRSEHCEAALFQAGYCFYLIKDDESADKTLARFLKDYPKSQRCAEASYYRGESLYNLKNLTEAAKEFRACIGRRPSPEIEARAHFWLGVCLQTENKLDDAIAEFNKAATTAGQDPQLAPQARLRAALVYSQQKNYEKCCERLLDLINDFKTYPIPAHIMAWLADNLMQRKDFANAGRVADLIIVRYGSDESMTAQVERAYAIGGQAKMQTGDWQQALEMFQELLRKFPNTKQIAVAKLGMAECYKQLRRFDQAAIELQEFIPAATGDLLMEAQEKLAGVFEAQGDRSQAAAVLERAVLLAPPQVNRDWLIRFNFKLGSLYESLQRKQDAIRAYRALESIPATGPEMLRLKKEATEKLSTLSAG